MASSHVSLEFIMDRIETGSGIVERRDSLTV
jgi:hypothetical protein